MKKSEKKRRELRVVNPNAAGVDIGSEFHYVAVPEGRGARDVERFGCTTAELNRMAEWLLACGVETVAMEATGVYWVSVCTVLEDHGLQVVLVDPRQVKNMKGRKTDVQDCSWIQKMHSFGLLSGAFRPEPQMQAVRDYWRQRTRMVREAATQIHLMQKSLDLMNVQLHKVLSDISGVSGMRILRAIVSNVRDPHALAALATTRISASQTEVEEALRGHYREQHVFALNQALKAFDFIHERLRECDSEIERIMKALPGETPPNVPTPKPARSKNQPEFSLSNELLRITGVDLTRIPGVSALTAQTVIAECGVDLSAFPTEHHFASWLGLSPNNQVTGGQVFSSKTRLRPSSVANALRLAAQSLYRSKSFLGDRFRSLRARLGPPKATTALAHLLAKLIYRALTKGQEFLTKGLENLQKDTADTKLLALKRRAAHLGFQLTPNSRTT